MQNQVKTAPKLFNTASRQKEVFVPMDPQSVRMYTCGPTVYNHAHIGNFRTYVFEDLLRRSLRFFGYNVIQVMNLTDVDDKTIKGAIAQDTTLDVFTKPFINGFFADLKSLNILPADHYPAATQYIPQMIKIIEVLLQKGIAYKGQDGSVYYAIKKFSRYGCLSHLHLDELKEGASERVASDEYDKDNVADFVLWKAYDPERDGKIYWESPFGKGRPGWHLECSAMAMEILGESIDIHCGGVDNMFPHHENEIAQSEAFSGKQFVTTWLHSEHLIVDGKKMSKSLGNFYTLRDLLSKGFTGPQVRYMLLQTHYKTQLNFTLTGLDSVKVTLQRLRDFIERMEAIKGTPETGAVAAAIDAAYQGFSESLADDLNISAALAALFDFVRQINHLADQGKVGEADAVQVLELLKKFDTVLGLLPFEASNEAIPQELQDALKQRNEARQQKNWALADTLRQFIAEKGYVIEDTAQGARLKKM